MMGIKTNKMPTTKVLLVFSWLIGSWGILGSGFLVVAGGGKVDSLINGTLVLLGAIFISALIRMLANIGQMFFDYKTQLYTQTTLLTQHFQIQTATLAQNLQDLKIQLQSQTATLAQNLQDLKIQLQSQTATLAQNLQDLKTGLEQVGCDTKDINQNINQIKTFFEQIERQLDLKK